MFTFSIAVTETPRKLSITGAIGEVSRLLREASGSPIELIRAHRDQLGAWCSCCSSTQTVDGDAVYPDRRPAVRQHTPKDMAIAPRPLRPPARLQTRPVTRLASPRLPCP